MARLTLPELERHLWGVAELFRGSTDSQLGEYEDADPAADSEEHRFHIPRGCFWSAVRKASVDIGTILDVSSRAIEDRDPRLKGVSQDVDFANNERFPGHLLEGTGALGVAIGFTYGAVRGTQCGG